MEVIIRASRWVVGIKRLASGMRLSIRAYMDDMTTMTRAGRNYSDSFFYCSVALIILVSYMINVWNMKTRALRLEHKK